MKTVKSLTHDAEERMQMWLDISEDKQALKDRGKTKAEALILANYFEGKVDGITECHKLMQQMISHGIVGSAIKKPQNKTIKSCDGLLRGITILCLLNADIKDTDELSKKTDEQLLKVGGIGRKNLKEIQLCLLGLGYYYDSPVFGFNNHKKAIMSIYD